MDKLNKQVRLLDVTKPNGSTKMFEENSGILFWDDIYNSEYYDIVKAMRDVFWQPQEIGMAKDIRHFDAMPEEEKELFKNAAGQLASLDSVATIYDTEAFSFIKDPAVKAVMAYVMATESIHNESYTYILSTLVTKEESKKAFRFAKENPYLVKRNDIITKYFKEFAQNPTIETFLKAQVANSALEGISFTNGFTPFYHFMRNGKMFSSGKIIQYIQQDETQHSYFQSMVGRDVLTQYPEYNTQEFAEWVYSFIKELVEVEKEFTEALYIDIEMIDVYEVQLFVEFKANQLLDGLGLTKIFETKNNPMKWVDAFHPDNFNAKKTDFIENDELNYKDANEDNNAWDEL